MIRIVILFCSISLVSITSLFSQNNWKLVKNSEDIKVYVKDGNDEKGYVNIKAVTTTKGSVASFAKVMQDVSNYNKWMHAVEETFLVSQQSDFDFSYYMLTDFPWPAKDRDAVINMKFNYNPVDKTFVTVSRDVKGLVPEKDNLTRVEKIKASYSFKQMHNGQVRIEYKGQIKPGVELPEWLMEQVYHIAPYNTLKNLREYVQNSKYKNNGLDLNKIG